MVHGVAKHVDERVLDFLDDGAIDLCAFAFRDQVDGLAGGAGNVAHKARELAEKRPNREHTNRHHPLVQLVDQLFDVRTGLAQRLDLAVPSILSLQRLAELRDSGAIDHQLANQVHQGIQAVDIDTNGLERLDLMARHLQLLARIPPPGLRPEIDGAPPAAALGRIFTRGALLRWRSFGICLGTPRLDLHKLEVIDRRGNGARRIGGFACGEKQLKLVANLLLFDLRLRWDGADHLAQPGQFVHDLQAANSRPVGSLLDHDPDLVHVQAFC